MNGLARYKLKFTTNIALFVLMSAAVVAIIAVGGTVFPVIAGSHRDITITAKQYEYDPAVITVNLGDEVTIRLKSSDVSHGFYLDGYDYDLRLKLKEEIDQNGSIVDITSEVVISFVADKPGKFRFRCSVTCGPYHPFMIGYFVVEPNYQFPISIGLAVLVVVASSVYMWKKGDKDG